MSGAHYDEDEENFFARRWHRYRRRHAAKKARIKAMPMGRRILRRGLVIGTWLLGLLAALMVTAIVLFYTLTNVPRPESLPLPQTATIQYSDGSTLAKIGPVDRTIVHIYQVPHQVRWAVLAAEDRGFYSEDAVSIRGTLRAAVSDATGGNTQGGSGITQQYVKNAYLTNSQTLSRKLRELMIAVKLSREYSKDQILEFYLNTVYFGRDTYGIQAASEAFFGEKVQQLTTAQGAVLAAQLRAPSYYDPALHPKAAYGRWKYVLDGMVKTGHLTQAQDNAMKFPKVKPLRGNGIGATGWRFFIKEAVMRELAEHGITENEVAERGLTIRTTISRKAQDAAVAAVHKNFRHLTKKQRDLKNALVAINPANGGVLAYYGGTGPDVKDYDGKIDYNDYADGGSRPPGSSFKPYTLATVLTQTVDQAVGKAHYAINTKVDGSYCAVIEGTKICNDPGDKSVSAKLISIRKAMKYSLNTTFDNLASQAGPDEVARIAHAMGIADTDANGTATLVDKNGSTNFGIGIGDYPVSVLDQADGYATLANHGVQNNAYLVQSATSSDGALVYQHKAHPHQAINKRVANDVTLTLKPVAAYSNDPLADGRESAAKTGTVGISTKTNNNSDAWMVGFTPKVSTAVWVGTGYTKPIYNRNGSPMYGADLPGQTWRTFMDKYLHGTPKQLLPVKRQIASDGGKPSLVPTYTPSDTPPPASNTPKPTFSITTGFPSTPPSTPTPTPTTTAPTTSVVPSPTKTHCRPTPLHPCPP